jgi:hypothetical protein
MSGPALLGLEGRVGYVVRVPDSWYDIDVHPATRDDSIRVLVEDRVRGNDDLWRERRSIITFLRQQAKAAYDAGATYCASFATPTDEGPVTGSVVISLVRAPAGSSEQDDLTEHLASLFTPVPKGRHEYDPWTSVGTVDVPGVGPCARSWGVQDVEVDGRGYIRNVFMQTAVPVPGSNKVFLISASSPVVPLAEPLLDLFDAVTGTFRLVDLKEVSRDSTD